MKKIIISIIISALFISVNAQNESNKTTDKENNIMTAKELYDAFKNDEAAANKQYAGKTMTIKGFVVYSGPDIYALPLIELSETKGGKIRSLCVLPFSDYLKLRKVSKGDEITIKGEVRAFYEKGDQVLMKECEIVEKNMNVKDK